MVWYCIISSRNCLSCRCRQSACELAGARNVVLLFVLLHSVKKEVAALYSGRRSSGRDATPDWVGCSLGPAQLRGMDTLLRVVPLAVPALHVDCLDVPRGLCSCWLLRPAARPAGKIPACELANPLAASIIGAGQFVAGFDRQGGRRLLHGSAAPVRWVLVLRSTTRASKVQFFGAAASLGFDPLSSSAICADDHSQKVV